MFLPKPEIPSAEKLRAMSTSQLVSTLAAVASGQVLIASIEKIAVQLDYPLTPDIEHMRAEVSALLHMFEPYAVELNRRVPADLPVAQEGT